MNNKSIALNVLQEVDKKISNVCKSEFNKTRKSKAILLIISDNEKQHYVAVKNLNSLLKDKNKFLNTFVLIALRSLELNQN